MTNVTILTLVSYFVRIFFIILHENMPSTHLKHNFKNIM